MNPQNTAFQGFQTPFHIHNGKDSPQIVFSNINSYSSYVGLAKFTLTASQILNLNTTPITLIPAPIVLPNSNSKSVVIVLGITANLVYGGTAYTGANNLEFRYTDASGVKVTADMANTFINSSANTYNYAPAVTSAFIPVANAPIVVRVPTANPATGNSLIKLVIHYRLISF